MPEPAVALSTLLVFRTAVDGFLMLSKKMKGNMMTLCLFSGHREPVCLLEKTFLSSSVVLTKHFSLIRKKLIFAGELICKIFRCIIAVLQPFITLAERLYPTAVRKKLF